MKYNPYAINGIGQIYSPSEGMGTYLCQAERQLYLTSGRAIIRLRASCEADCGLRGEVNRRFCVKKAALPVGNYGQRPLLEFLREITERFSGLWQAGQDMRSDGSRRWFLPDER